MMRVNSGRILVATIGALLACAAAQAGPREQAKRIHDRIAGVPPTAATLDQMETLVAQGNAVGAARIAMQAPSFYTTTLKNWITPWTNREQSVFAPLNDYTATVIGIIRDDVDYRQVLSGDILYVGGAGLPAYSPSNNSLYQQMEDQDVNLGDPARLVAATQSQLNGLPAADTAGVMTPSPSRRPAPRSQCSPARWWRLRFRTSAGCRARSSASRAKTRSESASLP